jgi:hypothetical protein
MAAEAVARLRTAPELATLLLELGRLIRARRYYKPGDARLAGVFERSLRAWRSDLVRRGALEVELVPEGFRERGGRGVLSHPQLAELQQDLAERGVHRLCFEEALDAETFAAFAEVLATDAGRTASRGGFAAALYAHTPAGIVVNGLSPATSVSPEPAGEAETEPVFLDVPSEEAKPPEPAAGAGEEAEAAPAPAQTLPELLRQLDACASASVYQDLVRRATLLATRAFEEGRSDELHRASVLLATHAHGKENPVLRELAGSFLRTLLQGPRLAALVTRVVRDLDEGELEASQVLLALGDAAVPVLLDAAISLEGNTERERLGRLVMTLGERALSAVLERLHPHEAAPRVRAAARIAGELQHPSVVAPLLDLVGVEDRTVRDEAVRALVRVGSDDAVAALAGLLDRETEGVALAAVHGLGSTGNARAVPHLERELGRAIAARDVPRAKEAIRALGRLGRPEAAMALVALVERRVRLGGGWLRELKAVAVSALAAVPGDEAVAALAQAAQARDTQLRRAAQTALDRRAQARARAGA